MLRSFVLALALTATTAFASKSKTIHLDIHIRGADQAQGGGQCSIYKNVDFLGWDTGAPVTGKKFEECCDLCKNRQGCKTYSWTNNNGGTCYLKNGHNDLSVYNEGVQSGILRSENVKYVFAYENNMDYEGGGNDIKHVPGGWIDKCVQPCMDTPGCGAISWNGDNGGTCWLKKARGAAKKKDGVASGVVTKTTK